MRNSTLLLPALALALAGCASSPAYRPPEVQVPPAFREAKTDSALVVTPAPAVPQAAPPAGPADTGAGLTRFWRPLSDTTLDRLIAEVLRTNPDVHAAEARLRGARAARLESAFDLAPTVTAGAGYTRQRLSNATFPIGGVGSFPDQDIWDAGFDASWELDLFGRVRRGVQAQGALVGAASEDVRGVQVALTAELARNYFELRGAQDQLAVARRNAENQRNTLQLTQERLDAGRGTAFDTERARAQLGFTLASIPDLAARVAAAQYQIGVLIGRPPAAVAGQLDSVVALPALPAAVTLASPDSLVRRRPDVAAAERQLAAEHAFVGVAKADYLPRITVGGSAGYSAGSLSSVGDAGTFRYAVGPVLSWPALNLGRIKARVDQSRALEAEAKARYTQTVLRALQEVETGLVRYRSSRERVARIQDAAEASTRAAELARLRFTGGVADFLQVLDAERTQLEAEEQLAQSRTDAATAYAALYQALGGGPLE
ncbi:MAG TPA: efflux transporter outer membrane subunit [Gemmatimonadales bacterium]|jgi:NodT family efflux transporter outer membrane factor (OMF) lipoprotein|nr:efflux transporter outer membrane subunit [Gemmatimonadales bacterium]